MNVLVLGGRVMGKRWRMKLVGALWEPNSHKKSGTFAATKIEALKRNAPGISEASGIRD